MSEKESRTRERARVECKGVCVRKIEWGGRERERGRGGRETQN